MLKCLAVQPAAALVDAEALTAADDVHLTIHAAAARHAVAWPPITVLACAPPLIAGALQRLGVDRHVALCASLPDGPVRAARRTPPATIRRYHGKLLIKPSAAAQRRIRERLRVEMRALRGANVAAVLRKINPIVRGWSAY